MAAASRLRRIDPPRRPVPPQLDGVLTGAAWQQPLFTLFEAQARRTPERVALIVGERSVTFGQMLADYRRDSVLAWGGRLNDLAVQMLAAQTAALRTAAARHLSSDGIAEDRQGHAFSLDMRYCGQSFTLAIPWTEGTTDWKPLREAFAARHTETFGYADADNDCEIVNVRLVSTGRVDKPVLEFAPQSTGDPVVERRRAWFDGGWTDCPVYDRAAMAVGFTIEGPAIVEEAGGTSIMPPGWRGVIDASGALICDALPRP